MNTLSRAERQRIIYNAHTYWALANAEGVASEFEPRGDDSDYNVHNVDMDASGEMEDGFAELVAQAMEAYASGGEKVPKEEPPEEATTASAAHLFTCRSGDPKTGPVLHPGPCRGWKSAGKSVGRYPAGKDPALTFFNRKPTSKEDADKRQDVTRFVAEAAIELEGLAAKGASHRGMAHVLATRLRRLGISKDRAPGDRVPFDAAAFNVEGPRPAVGSMVEVVRPGYSLSRGGSSFPVEFPVVRAVGDTERGPVRWKVPPAPKGRKGLADAARAVAAFAEGADDLIRREAPGSEIQDYVRRRMTELGFEPIDKAGEAVKFDPARHQVIGAAPSAGSLVHVVSPGYRRKGERGDVLIERPMVQTSTSPAGHLWTAARPVKKALKAVKDPHFEEKHHRDKDGQFSTTEGASAKKAAAKPRAPKLAPEQARERLRNAETMFGTDRSKWTAKQRRDAERLERLAAPMAAKPPEKKAATLGAKKPKAMPADAVARFQGIKDGNVTSDDFRSDLAGLTSAQLDEVARGLDFEGWRPRATKPQKIDAIMQVARSIEDSNAIRGGNKPAAERPQAARTGMAAPPRNEPRSPAASPKQVVQRARRGDARDDVATEIERLRSPQLDEAAVEAGIEDWNPRARKADKVEALLRHIDELRALPSAKQGDPEGARRELGRQATLRATSAESPSQGLHGNVDILTYPDGSKAVGKSFWRDTVRDPVESADAEELASLVAGAVEAPVPAAIRTGPQTLLEQYVAGIPLHRADRDTVREWEGSDGALLLGLADALTQNPDRAGNTLMDYSGGIWGIDFGSAFGRELQANRGALANAFDRENDMSPEDMSAITRRLEGLRDAFRQRGREEWFDAMMKRMAKYAELARGSRTRLRDARGATADG